MTLSLLYWLNHFNYFSFFIAWKDSYLWVRVNNSRNPQSLITMSINEYTVFCKSYLVIYFYTKSECFARKNIGHTYHPWLYCYIKLKFHISEPVFCNIQQFMLMTKLFWTMPVAYITSFHIKDMNMIWFFGGQFFINKPGTLV